MVKYISPQELKDLIKSKSSDYLVVDVRDNDSHGGNVKGAMNIPSKQFALKLPQLIDDTQNVSKVVFHCVSSRGRGPRLAKVYEEARLLQEGAANVGYESYVLEGGFASFQELFRLDPELVENMDP